MGAQYTLETPRTADGRAEPQPLLRYLAGHLVAGLLAGTLFFVAILLLDLFGLASLIYDDAQGWVAALLLLAGLAVTFGSAATAVGVMTLEREPEDR